MYRIALCDDDPAFVSSFQPCFQETLAEMGVKYALSLFPDADSLLSKLEQADEIDLLFLDIVLNGENGIDVAKRIRKFNARVDIIFITTEPSYAVDGYDAAPLHFLVKPITPEKLDQALRRFLAKHEAGRLMIKNKGTLMAIATDDIEYVEIFNHDILIHADSNRLISYSGTLRELEDVLTKRGFVRCHKSYIINLCHVAAISRYQVELTSRITLPIGKSRYNHIQMDFIAFAQNKLADD